MGQKFRRNCSLSCSVSERTGFCVQRRNSRWLWFMENNLWEKTAVDSSATLQVKNFGEIALSHSISERSGVCLRLTQKFKMAAKSGRENVFWKKSPVDLPHAQRVKNCRNRSISLHFRDKSVFEFNAEIQDGRQKLGKQFLEKVANRLHRYGSKISSKSLYLAPFLS